MSNPAHIAHFMDVLNKVHECEATHVGTVPIHEQRDGQTLWEGEVEVFDLKGHPEATRGYAWNYDHEPGSATITVLEVPPIISAKSAVQAALLAEGK